MSCIGEDTPCGIANEEFYYDITWTEDDLTTPIDLTGATAKMDLKDAATDVAVVQAMSGGIITPLAGAMRFTLTKAQTATLLPRAEATKSWVFSVKIVFADTTEDTIMKGTLTLEQVATA